jgi:hypothetical protein
VYAKAFEANLAGWRFLTGERRRYLTWRIATAWPWARLPWADWRRSGRPHHADDADRPQGTMRVQYLGYRFDQEEFRRDLPSLMNEP